MTMLGYDITIMMKKDFALSNKEIYVNYNDKFFIPSFTSCSAVISNIENLIHRVKHKK